MLRRHLIAALLGSAAARAQAACSVREAARVPLTRAPSGLMFAPVTINARQTSLLLDTGAERSVLSEDAVRALGLPLDQWVSTRMEGVGGVERHRNADVAKVEIGGQTLRRRALSGVVSLPVAPSLARAFPAGAGAGLLGMDLLSLFDLEIDPAGPSLALYSVQDCGGRFLPWQEAYAAVPAALPRVGVMVAPVGVNGAPLRALVDTGSTTTLIDARAARRAGLAEGENGRSRGLGPDALAVRATTLRELRLGSSVWTGVAAQTALLPGLGYDMILGMDVLGTRRLWLSFAASALFVADGR